MCKPACLVLLCYMYVTDVTVIYEIEEVRGSWQGKASQEDIPHDYSFLDSANCASIFSVLCLKSGARSVIDPGR